MHKISGEGSKTKRLSSECLVLSKLLMIIISKSNI